MDPERGNTKPEVVGSNPVGKSRNWVFVVLRFLALCGTVSATLVMALNKETKTFVVAIFGTNRVNATVQAKFQDSPAFVFFVVVNAIGSLHNLLILGGDLLGHKYDFKGLRPLLVTMADMATIALLSAASGAAASISEVGKHGNSHARWNKICDRFGKYCDHGGGALIAAFLGIVFLMLLNALSIIALHKKSSPQSVVP